MNHRPHCLVCGAGVAPSTGPVTVCDRCQAPHHGACWEWIEGCARFGCRPAPSCTGRPGPGNTRPARADRAPVAFSVIGGLLLALSCCHLTIAPCLTARLVSPMAAAPFLGLGLLAAHRFWRWSAALGLAVLIVIMAEDSSPWRWWPAHGQAVGCNRNMHDLDKLIGVWEATHRPFPVDRRLFIEFDASGRIDRLSREFERLQRGMRPADQLVAGSGVLGDLSRDRALFRCPTCRLRDPGSYGEDRREVTYRWESHPEPRPHLEGRRRGVICLPHGAIGADGTPERAHVFR